MSRLVELLAQLAVNPPRPVLPQHAKPGERTGRCLCGSWVVDHYDEHNRKVSCAAAHHRAIRQGQWRNA